MYNKYDIHYASSIVCLVNIYGMFIIRVRWVTVTVFTVVRRHNDKVTSLLLRLAPPSVGNVCVGVSFLTLRLSLTFSLCSTFMFILVRSFSKIIKHKSRYGH